MLKVSELKITERAKIQSFLNLSTLCDFRSENG